MDTPGFVETSPQGQAARQALGEAAKSPFALQQYGLVVRQVARALRQHGLGQALAFIQLRSSDRPGSPYHLLGRQLDRWLLAAMGVSASSALAAITGRDSRFYLEANQQAWLFLRALRQGLEESS
jgi:CRISPR-associated protein (Cas_Cmr5)